MNPQLQDKLFKKYPKIFAQKDQSMQTTAMCRGIECRDGWYWLIDQLCECIQGYMVNLKDQIEALQVKEKFGGLRFYTNYSDSDVDGMIWFAESLSLNICETCGSTENVTQTKGWAMTRCKKCIGES
jgi:hypothetical protein